MRRPLHLWYGSVAVIAAVALVVAPAASASWSPYFGPGTFIDQNGIGNDSAKNTTNYWTNNRVYRPLGYHFVLAYDDGTYHFSADNTSTNPFYFAAYGYNYLECMWDWTKDPGYTSVNPVTCQEY
jgi:hypothetical protein